MTFAMKILWFVLSLSLFSVVIGLGFIEFPPTQKEIIKPLQRS
jgi:hypothetical protein